jgi:hypothetical protein
MRKEKPIPGGIDLGKLLSTLHDFVEVQKKEINSLKESNEEASEEMHLLFHEVDFLISFIEKLDLTEELYEFINENLMMAKNNSIEKEVLNDLLQMLKMERNND